MSSRPALCRNLLLILLTLLVQPASALARTWTHSSGDFTLEADLVDFKDGKVHLKKTNGKIIVLPLASLSKSDQEFVRNSRLPSHARSAAGAAVQILKRHCHKCHGQDGTDEGGLNYLSNLPRLLASRMVVPGRPKQSPLLKRMVDGEMPPEDVKARPTVAEMEVLRKWIADGAKVDAAPPRQLIRTRDIYKWVSKDLNRSRASDLGFLRYFSIAHLYNAGATDGELQTVRLALVKLLNSLSWHKELALLNPIDKEKTLFRLDIRKLGWGREQWRDVVAPYPYNVELSTSYARSCSRLTGTTVPIMRADWFVAFASRPPLYHTLLRLPESIQGLESRLGVRFDQNVEKGNVARAGFTNSGISQSPRIIERHKIDSGNCWVSHDFAGASGKRNFFQFPINFEADGGEVIFSLPNGLNAYMLVDSFGQRIDRAPTAIVKDDQTRDGAVVNGISCMRCHAAGIIPKTDQVRKHVKANPKAFADELRGIFAIYPESSALDKLVKQDSERFTSTLRKLGFTRFSSPGEPIYNTSRRYFEPLTIEWVSAELGLPLDNFNAAIEKRASLQRVVGALRVRGGMIPRDVFVATYRDMVHILGLGRHRRPEWVPPSWSTPGWSRPRWSRPGWRRFLLEQGTRTGPFRRLETNDKKTDGTTSGSEKKSGKKRD